MRAPSVSPIFIFRETRRGGFTTEGGRNLAREGTTLCENVGFVLVFAQLGLFKPTLCRGFKPETSRKKVKIFGYSEAT